VGGGPTDGQLLERFAARRDERAFEALVRRHGALVLGVCRRVLPDPRDAEDAFQATFFVLARRAGSIRKAEAVVSWLYGVAHRLALQARARGERRRAREQVATDVRAAERLPAAAAPADLMDGFPERAMRADPLEEVSRREVRAAVDEELCRLPEKYRAPLLLCDLAGQSHAEAARELTWPVGTLKTRLAHARSLVRVRLARRGLALSAAALAALLAEGAAAAAMPSALLTATVRSALAFAAGRAAAGGFSPGAAALAEKGLHMLVLNKLHMAAVVSVMVGLVGAGSLALLHPAAQAQAAPAASAPAAEPASPAAEDGGPAARTDRQGDPLPPGALARMGTVRLRHGGPVSFVAFLPGGKELLSAGADGMARVWDLATGREVRRFGAPPGTQPAGPGALFGTSVAAVSPDGKTLALADGVVIRLWEVATGKAAGEIQGLDQPAAGLAFAPDGTTLAAHLSGGEVRLFAAGTHKEIRRFNEPPAGGLIGHIGGLPVVFAPDGKTLATQSLDFGGGPAVKLSPSIKLWDVATGKLTRQVRDDVSGQPSDPAFSPDGKIFAWAAGDGSVILTDAATGEERHRLKGDGPASFAFAPDGKRVVTWLPGDRAGAVWDVTTGKEVRRFGKVREARPRVRGGGFAVGGMAAGGGAVGVVRVGGFVKGPGFASCLAISPDGKRLASAGDGSTVLLLDLATGQEVHTFTGHQTPVTAVRYSADGKSLTSRGADGVVRRWEAATGKEIGRAAPSEEAFGGVLSPDGRRRASFAEDGTLKVRDAATGRELCAIKSAAPGAPPGAIKINIAGPGMLQFSFSPDGNTLAVTGFQDPTVRLYDVTTGKEVRALGAPRKTDPPAPGGGFTTLAAPPLAPAFSPDGKLLVAGTGAALRVWEVATGRELPSIVLPKDSGPGGMAFAAVGLAFAPDSRSLALERSDGTVMLWELATGKLRRQYGTPVKAEGFAVSSGPGGGIVFLQVAAGIGSGFGNPSTLAVAPDGRTIAQARGRAVRLWDLLTGQELAEFKGHQGAVTALAFALDGKTLATGSGDTTALVWDVAARAGKRKPAADLSARELGSLWEVLAGDDAARAFDAVAALAGAPQKAAPFLREHVKPAAVPDARQVEKLIADLDSDDFGTREKASAGLKKLGALAAPALKKALADNPSAEVRLVAEELLRRAGDAAAAGDDLRLCRAVEALERMGTPEACAVLKALARGAPGARVTAAAAAALERAGK
jgi:RNA polymerase sigma factor (sigma-70 family)